MLGEHHELKSNHERMGQIGKCSAVVYACYVYTLWQVRAILGKQISFSSLPPAKIFLNSKFHLIIHILFNNSFSSHLVRVTACSQAAENILHYTQLGRMLTLFFFVKCCFCNNFQSTFENSVVLCNLWWNWATSMYYTQNWNH